MKTLAYLVLALGALGCGAGVACGAGAARSQKRWAGAVGLASVHAPIGNRLLSFEGYSTAAAALLTWPPGLPIAAGGLLVLGSAFGAFLFVLRRRKADGTGGRSGALAAGPPAASCSRGAAPLGPADRQDGQEATGQHLDALTRLAELTALLAAGDGAEDLCRRAVEHGREKLRCDRMSIWLADGDALHVRGTFSADEEGNVRDAGSTRLTVPKDSAMGRVLSGKSALDVRQEVLLDAQARRVGTFCSTVVAIQNRDGEEIGALSADSLPPRRPWGEYTARLLRLYGVVVGRLLEGVKQREDLASNEERYRELLESANSIILRRDVDGAITFFNEFAQSFFGYSEEEVLGRQLVGTIVPETDSGGRDLAGMMEDIGQHPERHATGEHENMRRDGERVWVSWTNKALLDDEGRVREILCVGNDVTPCRRAERQVSSLQRLHQNTLATIPSALLVLDPDLNITMASSRFLKERNVEVEAVVGKNLVDVFPESFLNEGGLLVRIGEIADSGGQEEFLGLPYGGEADGGRHLDVRICGIKSAEGAADNTRVLVVMDDVSERRVMEEHLQQAAKMESIGRLAGGVAHDFNNLLTVINGYSELIARDETNSSKTRKCADEIIKVSSRAADLTRQLQAFGRSQPLQSRVLDLNAVVNNMQSMLRRVIGEDVELITELADDLGCTRADQVQIEQVLVNLAVNSRDAMPYGGKLVIRTVNVEVDWKFTFEQPGAKPGVYVMVAVSDTGCGMDQETLEHVFEPFFTTKEVGKGTGLGLATVYGIVKQHEGNTWVESEPGKGTTFKIYLPRVEAEPQAVVEAAADARAPHGTETILLVEDESALRTLARRMLEEHGYGVLTAASADEAEAVFAQQSGEIDLLVTDVIMPRRSGRDLYEVLAGEYPWLKVLYISGYADSAILHHGVLDAGTAFLQKPFTTDVLAQKVREVLDGVTRTAQEQRTDS